MKFIKLPSISKDDRGLGRKNNRSTLQRNTKTSESDAAYMYCRDFEKHSKVAISNECYLSTQSIPTSYINFGFNNGVNIDVPIRSDPIKQRKVHDGFGGLTKNGQTDTAIVHSLNTFED